MRCEGLYSDLLLCIFRLWLRLTSRLATSREMSVRMAGLCDLNGIYICRSERTPHFHAHRHGEERSAL